MCKKLLVSALVLLLSLTGIAYAKNMYIWRDPSLNFSDLKKILVAPAKAILNAGTQMRPTGKVQKDLEAWTTNALRTASKGKILVHTLEDAKREHDFLYDEPAADVSVILSRLIEMGYQAQEFDESGELVSAEDDSFDDDFDDNYDENEDEY